MQFFARNSQQRHRSAAPSSGAVPVPFIHQDERIRRRCSSMVFSSSRCAENVDKSAAIDCSSPDVHPAHGRTAAGRAAARPLEVPDCAASAAIPVVFQRHGFGRPFCSVITSTRSSPRGQLHRNNGTIFLRSLSSQHRMTCTFQTQFICSGEFRHRGVNSARNRARAKHCRVPAIVSVPPGSGHGSFAVFFRELAQKSARFPRLRPPKAARAGYSPPRFDGSINTFARRARSVYHSGRLRRCSPARESRNDRTQRDVVFSRLRHFRAPPNLLQILSGSLFASLCDASADSPQLDDGITLISPFGSTHRRIAACTSRKSPTEAARAASKETSPLLRGNCAAAIPLFQQRRPSGIRRLQRHPGPSMRSTSLCGSPARQTQLTLGAQPLARFTNMRTPIPAPRGPSRLKRIHSSTPRRTRRPQPQQFAQLVELQYVCAVRDMVMFASISCQMICTSPGGRRHIHQPAVASAPRRRVSTSTSRRDPEPAAKNLEHREGFRGHHDLFSISTQPISTSVPVRLAATKTIRAPDQNAKSRSFPGLPAHFDVDPGIELRGFEESAVTPMFFPPASFAPRDTASNRAAVTAAANRKSVLRQSSPQDPRLFIIRVSLARPRTPKHGDDKFFPICSFDSLRVLVFQPVLRRRHVETPPASHAQPGQASELRGSSRPDCCSRKKRSPSARRSLCKSRTASSRVRQSQSLRDPSRRQRVFMSVSSVPSPTPPPQDAEYGPNQDCFCASPARSHGPRSHQIVPRQSRGVRLITSPGAIPAAA